MVTKRTVLERMVPELLTANLSAARFLSSKRMALERMALPSPLTWHFHKRTANARLAEPFRRLRDWDAALHDRGGCTIGETVAGY